MLYEGAIRFLRQSAEAMEERRYESARASMRRAEAILDELNVALDMSRGEIPLRLRALYLFSKRQLREASLRGDPRQIEPVVRLLAELRDAWAEACTKAGEAGTENA